MTVSYFIPLFARRLCPGVASKGANAKTRILHTLIPTLSVLPPSPAPLSCNMAVQNQEFVYLFHAVHVSRVKAKLSLAVCMVDVHLRERCSVHALSEG